ncbi:hypothetical protein LLG88_00530, partial [bacterium]|nr:hypothetical protein [bacterium]
APRGAASARSAPARRAPPLRGRTRTTPDGRGARRSKISIYRSDVTLPGLVVLLVGVSSSLAGAKRSVKVIDSDGERCVNCATGESAAEVLEAARLSRALDLRAWLSEHMIQSPMLRALPPGPARDSRRQFAGEVSRKVCLATGLETICYEHVPCRLWDCYKSYMSRFDASGHRLWRTRVPTMDVPVVPFVHSGSILYLSNGERSVALVVVRYDNGDVLEQIELPESLGLVVAEMRPTCPAAVVADRVVIQGWRRGKEGVEVSDIFVVDVGHLRQDN